MATVPPPPPPGTVPVTAAGAPATAGGAPMYVTTSAAPGATRYDSDSGPSKSSEIKLISHSPLFYWWPVWAVAFLMALATALEGNRLAVVPPKTRVVAVNTDDPKNPEFRIVVPEQKGPNPVIARAAGFVGYDATQEMQAGQEFTRRISGESWPGAIFIVTLVLTIIITTVPLRGLWSFLVIVMIVALALLFALLDIWEKIFNLLGNLHIHINMAGYVTLGVILFTLWALATFVFDRRTFVIFTPGQIRVCEHIGDSVQSYPTATVVLEKQRDDLFRHYIYGLGSGDLIIKVGGAEKREIRMPNILFLGFRLARVEDMLRTVATT